MDRENGSVRDLTVVPFIFCRQLFFCAVLAGVGAGQCVPNWVDGVCAPGVAGKLHSFAVFDDGTGSKLYRTHMFGPGPTFLPAVGVWDGTTWNFVSPPVTGGTILNVCVYDDGTGPSLYISGTFTNPNRIAKWDGGANVTPLGAGVNSAPNGMLVHDEGSGPKLFVYGNLSMAGGMPANRMAKWDGAAWSSAGWVGSGAVNVAFSSSAGGRLDAPVPERMKIVGQVLDLPDADRIEVELITKRARIAYPNGLAALDPSKTQPTTKITLDERPSSFRFEAGGRHRVFINAPKKGKVVAADPTKAEVVDRWKLVDAKDNGPMALDEAGRRLFVVCRKLARVLAYDTDTGKVVAWAECIAAPCFRRPRKPADGGRR